MKTLTIELKNKTYYQLRRVAKKDGLEPSEAASQMIAVAMDLYTTITALAEALEETARGKSELS